MEIVPTLATSRTVRSSYSRFYHWSFCGDCWKAEVMFTGRHSGSVELCVPLLCLRVTRCVYCIRYSCCHSVCVSKHSGPPCIHCFVHIDMYRNKLDNFDKNDLLRRDRHRLVGSDLWAGDSTHRSISVSPSESPSWMSTRFK